MRTVVVHDQNFRCACYFFVALILLLASLFGASTTRARSGEPDDIGCRVFPPTPFDFAQAAFADAASAQNPPDAQSTQSPAQPKPAAPAAKAPDAAQTTPGDQANGAKPAEQPKRILGIMPNFRAVSAGTRPPPPTPKQAFVLATKNSFDYSALIFVGLTSLLAEGSDTHSQLGKGVAGFGRYYWRGFLDKADGNYMVIFAMPTIFHQDERYYAKGSGGFLKRFVYATSRVLITPNYQGHDGFNVSELLGRGIAQGVSLSYYPSKTRTLGGISSKYAYALLRDAATNAFREFWPDIATHVLHRHP